MLEPLTLCHTLKKGAGIQSFVSEVSPEDTTKNADVGGIVGDEATPDVRSAKCTHRSEKLEHLCWVEMFENVGAIDPIAGAGEFLALLGIEKLEDVHARELEALFHPLLNGWDVRFYAKA